MQINSANLDAIRVGFNASYQQGLDQAETQYGRVATTVPSSAASEKFGWLAKIPNVREWFGDRVVQNISEHDYEIKNKDFELTIGVDRNAIMDDTLGVYAPLFQEMGLSTAAHPDQLVFALMKAGFATECFDGQFFFDTDHPVLDANGDPQSVANTDGGGGEPWFLMSTRRAIKPIIYQTRKPWEFVALDNPNDQNVFHKKEFQYGVDNRSNVGFGFWQMAWGSKQTLEQATYKLARESLIGMKGDYDKPLGIMPDLLVTGPSNELAGLELLNAERNAAGETNVYKGTAELLVVPWLASALSSETKPSGLNAGGSLDKACHKPFPETLKMEMDMDDQPNNLTMLKGIGKKSMDKLHEAGILTFAQIIDLDAEGREKYEDVLGLKGHVDWEALTKDAQNCIDEAAQAAADLADAMKAPNTKSTSGDPEGHTHMRVVAHRKEGFRRGGIQFTREPMVLNLDDLSEEQLAAICDEENLSVDFVTPEAE